MLVTITVHRKSGAVLSIFMQIIVKSTHEKSTRDLSLGIEQVILKLA